MCIHVEWWSEETHQRIHLTQSTVKSFRCDASNVSTTAAAVHQSLDGDGRLLLDQIAAMKECGQNKPSITLLFCLAYGGSCPQLAFIHLKYLCFACVRLAFEIRESFGNINRVDE